MPENPWSDLRRHLDHDNAWGVLDDLLDLMDVGATSKDIRTYLVANGEHDYATEEVPNV